MNIFKSIENQHDVFIGKDCMKKFCECLSEHEMEIINLKKKKNKVINKRAAGIIWKCEVRDHSHYTEEYRRAAHSICNLKYSVPKKIPIDFHDGSNYDYHFIIKDLAKEF